MRSPLVSATKVIVLALFAALVVCQVWVVPMIASGFARTAPEFAALETPGILLAGLLLACGEVVLVCVWRLLTFVAEDTVFDDKSFRWVNAIVAAVGAAGVVVVTGLFVIGDARAGSPFVVLVGALLLVVIIGLVLIISVMRELLRRATLLEEQMAEVV
ncbi:DUF2975 domain-containing protein [Microbacterium dauci]|uniref:DUF2975 domain-containing protein n=1 Tax=Microbacterium dauci TaxID=3048008 RepID=A0ABT6ZGN8_9MICO|nr:DUF2975 domain-containing protein [Microbacterium sp. LX3-4]MDJ1115327.1 DUF2975 domain-containing protein [Microbacterium sp. LX3-4]